MVIDQYMTTDFNRVCFFFCVAKQSFTNFKCDIGIQRRTNEYFILINYNVPTNYLKKTFYYHK